MERRGHADGRAGSRSHPTQLYDLPDAGEREIVVDAVRVRDRLKAIAENEDLRKYIL